MSKLDDFLTQDKFGRFCKLSILVSLLSTGELAYIWLCQIIDP